MIVVGFIIGIVFGGLICFYVFNKKINSEFVSKKTLRDKLSETPPKRGLLKEKFTFTSEDKDPSKSVVVNLSIEFVVIDSSPDMIKIEIIGYKSSNVSCADAPTGYYSNVYKKAFDGIWLDKNDTNIKWLSNDKMDNRIKIINKILNTK